MERQLKSGEEALRVFKENYMGELPEQLETNLRAIEQLQLQRNSVQDTLRDNENRQLVLEGQLADTPRYTAGGQDDRQELYSRLAVKRQALTELQSRYSELYPDVVQAREEVRELEARIAALGGEGATPAEGVQVESPGYARLRSQVDENALRIQSLRGESNKLSERMTDLQKRVENAPKREQELMSLSRDYETIKQAYDSLLQRKLSAGIAENMETHQKSEQFQILDPANLPEKPVKPERLKIVAIGILVGLALGGGLGLAADYLDRSYRTLEEVRASLPLPVLGVIPRLITDQEIARSKKQRWALAAACLLLMVASVAVILFYMMGVDFWSRAR
jgi:polysaccharide chain length determinant protein (PEP-CTERM system associated)